MVPGLPTADGVMGSGAGRLGVPVRVAGQAGGAAKGERDRRDGVAGAAAGCGGPGRPVRVAAGRGGSHA